LGRKKYQAALDTAATHKDKGLQARAAFFWVREELRADPVAARELMPVLDEMEPHLPHVEFKHLTGRLRQQLGGTAARH
jgi:hypothetical protein